jgi:hypothetical protein
MPRITPFAKQRALQAGARMFLTFQHFLHMGIFKNQ